MDFSDALREIRSGKKVFRYGWNGKGLFIFFQKGYPDGIIANANTQEALGLMEGAIVKVPPYLMIRDIKNGSIISWVPSQSDLMADDWFLFSETVEPK